MVVGTSWPMASKTGAVMEREIDKRIGENVAIYRRSRGLSQVVLSGLVGRTESWLSQIERGVLRVDRLSVLVELARVLKVEVGDLLGGPPLLKSASGGGYEGLPALRHALLRPDPVAGILEPAAGDEPRALAALQADVAHTWGLLHTCRYAALARRTQHLIDVARAHSQLGRDAAAAVILLQAGRFGPEEVRYQPLARDLLRYLLQRDSPILHAELRALAEQIGMLG